MHRLGTLFCIAVLPLIHDGAHAQIQGIEQGITFTLKPRNRLFAIEPVRTEEQAHSFAARPDRIVPDDRAHDIRVAVKRQNRRFTNMAAVMPTWGEAGAGDDSVRALRPRSRTTQVMIVDRLPLDDDVTAELGWRGVKLSNHNANVTAGAGDGELRARDWFLPHAALHVEAAPTLRLEADYTETMLGYADTGRSGPLGLTREAFRSLGDNLRPETRSRLRLMAGWTPHENLTLTASAFGGRIDDRLTFVDRGYLPFNAGSARMDGGRLMARHRLSPDLSWSLHYDAARARIAGDMVRSEQGLTVEGQWTRGPWRAMMRAAYSGAPALTARTGDASLTSIISGAWVFAEARPRPFRFEAGLDYAATSLCRCPLRLGARLTDPNRMAGAVLEGEQLAGAISAGDQARAMMLSAALDW